MKILIVNAFFPPMTTGSAHFSLDVARQYKRLGHDVAVLTTHHDSLASDDTRYDFPVFRVPTKWVAPGKISFNYRLPICSRPKSVRFIRSVIETFEPDIIHQNGQFFDLTLWTTMFSLRRGTPRVLTVHTPLTHTSKVPRALISLVDRLFLRAFAICGESRLVGVDKFTIDLLERRYKPNRPVVFIPATLEVAAFGAGDSARVIENFDLANKKVILSFGHVIPIRSRVPLIKALPGIVSEIPNAQVVVVGEVYDNTFMKVAQRLGLSDHVTVVGRVPHEEVPDYLAAADIEVHDLDGHGIGITTFEVMAAGVPIVASVDNEVFPGIDLSRWPKVHILGPVTDGELANVIVGILGSDELERREICDSQLDFISKNFSVEVVGARYLDLFNELLQGD